MGRPAMSAKTTSKHLSKSEMDAKNGVEEMLKGRSDKLKPPKYLTTQQKKIFRFIVKELEASGTLGNLDIYILTECCIALDRMQGIESSINQEPCNILNDKLLQAKDKYTKSFFRCCNELCLSPQARAKMGNLNLKTKEENPLIKILTEDE